MKISKTQRQEKLKGDSNKPPHHLCPHAAMSKIIFHIYDLMIFSHQGLLTNPRILIGPHTFEKKGDKIIKKSARTDPILLPFKHLI